MSFLIDPALLVANGAAIGRLTRSDRSAKVAEAATLATFLGISVGLYLDKEFTRRTWERCGAETGRDWMLNSGVFAFDYHSPSRRTHAVAAGIFATYPLWLRLGTRLGRRRRRRVLARR